MKKIVPKLRFKEFNDNWQEKSFDNIFSFLKNNSLSRAELNYEIGTIQNIHYGDILIKFPEILDTKNYNLPYINENNSIKYDNKEIYLKDKDIIFADTAEDYTAGKACEIINIENKKIVSGLHTIPCRPILNFEKGYLGFYLNSNKFHNQLIPLITGIKVLSITKNNIINTTIKYPSLKEQNKISTLLNLINKKIQLQQEKIENLKLYKLYTMKNIFEKKTNWNKYKLFEICEFYSGGTPTSSNKKFYNGTIPFIRSGEIHQKTTELYINAEALKNSSAKLVKKGDILYALYGATSGEVSISQIDGAINQAILCIKSLNAEISNYFIKEYLKYEKDNIIKKYLQGGQGNLSANIIKNIDIYIPHFEKQEKICKTFILLDEKINTNIKKLEELENIKLYLLRNLFI